jgi:hypothetical protein
MAISSCKITDSILKNVDRKITRKNNCKAQGYHIRLGKDKTGTGSAYYR